MQGDLIKETKLKNNSRFILQPVTILMCEGDDTNLSGNKETLNFSI